MLKNILLVAGLLSAAAFVFLVFPCVGKTPSMIALAGVVVFGGGWAILHNNPQLLAKP